jgi:hypothetical protein
MPNANTSWSVRCHAALTLAKMAGGGDEGAKAVSEAVLKDNMLISAVRACPPVSHGRPLTGPQPQAAEVLTTRDSQRTTREQRRAARTAAAEPSDDGELPPLVDEEDDQLDTTLAADGLPFVTFEEARRLRFGRAAARGAKASGPQVRLAVETIAYLSVHGAVKSYLAQGKRPVLPALLSLAASRDRAVRYGLLQTLHNCVTSGEDILEEHNSEVEKVRRAARARLCGTHAFACSCGNSPAAACSRSPRRPSRRARAARG